MDILQRDVLVFLRGGLGNQLFQYFAGQIAAQTTAGKLVLDTSEISLTHDRVGISAFQHSASERISWRPTWGLSPSVDLRYLKWRESRPQRTSLERIRNLKSLFEMTAGGNASQYVLDGFFSSPEIPSECQSRGIPVQIPLKNPSRWYEELSAQALAVDPIMIHVRRGDYRDNSQWGLLGLDYYRDALKALGYNRQRQIWVFSDEPLAALDLISQIVPSRYLTLIVPAKRTPAAESLMLMSQASTLVTANSTMSWWAGCMGAKLVAAPFPFHPRPKVNSGLTPLISSVSRGSWINVPVTWT